LRWGRGGVVKPYTDGEKQRERDRTRGRERERAETRERERWPQREETPGWEGRRETETPRDLEGRNPHAENAHREREAKGWRDRKGDNTQNDGTAGRAEGWVGAGLGGGGAGREKRG